MFFPFRDMPVVWHGMKCPKQYPLTAFKGALQCKFQVAKSPDLKGPSPICNGEDEGPN